MVSCEELQSGRCNFTNDPQFNAVVQCYVCFASIHLDCGSDATQSIIECGASRTNVSLPALETLLKKVCSTCSSLQPNVRCTEEPSSSLALGLLSELVPDDVYKFSFSQGTEKGVRNTFDEIKHYKGEDCPALECGRTRKYHRKANSTFKLKSCTTTDAKRQKTYRRANREKVNQRAREQYQANKNRSKEKKFSPSIIEESDEVRGHICVNRDLFLIPRAVSEGKTFTVSLSDFEGHCTLRIVEDCYKVKLYFHKFEERTPNTGQNIQMVQIMPDTEGKRLIYSATEEKESNE